MSQTPPDDDVGHAAVAYVPKKHGKLAEWWRRLDTVDDAITTFMRRVGIRLLRYSLAVIFIWFGALKLFDMSPADALVRDTVAWLPGDLFVPILGVWEVLIGIFLIFRPTIRIAIALLFLQMLGAMSPIFLLPDRVFTSIPFGLTLEGQYIVKNVAMVSAALVVGGTVRQSARDQDRWT